MEDIDQAYEILGLKSGASLRQVDEAYHDLRELWDPKRFSENPRLRIQAGEKKERIENAYEAIIEHLSRNQSRRAGPKGRKEGESSSNFATDSTQPSANLLEDAFSGRISGERKRVPAWLIVVLVIIAGLILSYLAVRSSQERTETIRTAVQEEEESELTKLVQEVRGRYTERNGESTSESAPERSQETSVTPPAKPKAPPPEPPTKRATTVEKKTLPPARKEPEQPPPPLPAAALTERPPNDKPLLIREELGSLEEEPAEPVEAGPPDDQLAAFTTLLRKSKTASKLVKGQIGTLNFVEWSIIQETSSEMWIDLVATWASGQEVHFFWSVNPSTGDVRPINQAARNLEASMASP
jgi:curved DNA-binding protein CbpA